MVRVTLPSISLGEAALALWALVALVITASIAHSWLAARRIVRRARPLDDARWIGPLWEVADRLGLDEPPRLLRSDDARMPFACGLRAPTVVVPAESDAWSLDRRRAVLLHELAHVRRRDLAGHTLARLVCAAYWFHPLVWTAAKRLRAESERACDDLALACGARAADYAEHLLDIVTSVRRDTTTPLVALAMARRSEFEGRMLDILDPERPRGVPDRRHVASLVGVLALVTFVVGAAAPAPARRAVAKGARPAPAVAAAKPLGISADGSAPRPAAPARRATPPDSTAVRSLAEQPAERAAQPTQPTPPMGSTEPSAGAPANVTPQPGVRRVVMTSDGRFVSLERVNEVVREALAARRGVVPNGAPGAASGDERAELLARVLRTDTSASIRRVAAWGLRERADVAAAGAALAAAVRSDASAAVREMAAWSLSEGGGGAAARDALVDAMRADADTAVRVTAAWSLGSRHDAAVADALAAALNDASRDVRTTAVWALGSVEPDRAPPGLATALQDRNARVRRLAAWALYQIRDPATVPALQEAMRAESDAALRVAYVRALSALGERSVDALRDLLDSKDAGIRDAAVHALAGRSAFGAWPWPWPRPRPNP